MYRTPGFRAGTSFLSADQICYSSSLDFADLGLAAIWFSFFSNRDLCCAALLAWIIFFSAALSSALTAVATAASCLFKVAGGDELFRPGDIRLYLTAGRCISCLPSAGARTAFCADLLAKIYLHLFFTRADILSRFVNDRTIGGTLLAYILADAGNADYSLDAVYLF